MPPAKLLDGFWRAYHRCERNQEVAQSLVYSSYIIIASSEENSEANAELADVLVSLGFFERIQGVVKLYPDDPFIGSSKYSF
jgi:hypothetical protein